MNTLEGQQEWCKRRKKMTEVVRPCEENERAAHSEKNARCGHARENEKGQPNLRWNEACKTYYERERVERGQCNKQDIM